MTINHPPVIFLQLFDLESSFHLISVIQGCVANLVIFDPDKAIDMATWENPHQYPKGIDFVIVNGQTVVNQGDHTGRLPGKILKKELTSFE